MNDTDTRVLRILRALQSSDRIRRTLVQQVRRYDQMFSGTVFPPFADPDRQAEDAAQRHWDERMSESVGENGPDADPGDIADDAQAAGLAFYQTVIAMHHAVLNLFAAGLFHLFEQQIASLYRDWTGRTAATRPLDSLRNWLREEAQIDVTRSPSWNRLYELELLANVVKHAEGRSANELRGLNPDYFRQPFLRETAFRDIPTTERPVETPLTGGDIYVTKGDYDRFLEAVLMFLEWLAAELHQALPVS